MIPPLNGDPYDPIPGLQHIIKDLEPLVRVDKETLNVTVDGTTFYVMSVLIDMASKYMKADLKAYLKDTKHIPLLTVRPNKGGPTHDDLLGRMVFIIETMRALRRATLAGHYAIDIVGKDDPKAAIQAFADSYNTPPSL